MKSRRWFKEKNKHENAIAVVLNLLHHLFGQTDRMTVSKILLSNSEYPNVISLTMALKHWNVESMVVKLPTLSEQQITTPCIAHLSDDSGHFVMIHTVADGIVRYIDPKWGWKIETVKSFEEHWTGVLLLPAIDNESHRSIQKTVLRFPEAGDLRSVVIAVSIISLIGLVYLTLPFNDILGRFVVLGYCLVSFIGISLSVLLLLKNLGYSHTAITKICGISSDRTCDLSDSYAFRIFGLDLSESFLFYFSGNLFCILLASANGTQFPAWNYVMFINGVGVIVSSALLCYMFFVVRKVCRLCLLVHISNILGLVALVYLLNHRVWRYDGNSALLVILTYTIMFGFVLAIRHIVGKTQRVREIESQPHAVKYNNNVARTLLFENPELPTEHFTHEIMFGNSKAETIIILVTHPFCSFCADVHRIIGFLLSHSGELYQVRIRFAITPRRSNMPWQ